MKTEQLTLFPQTEKTEGSERRYRYHVRSKVFFQEHPQWHAQAGHYLWKIGCFSEPSEFLPARLGEKGFLTLSQEGYRFIEPECNPDWLKAKHYVPRKTKPELERLPYTLDI